MGMGRRRRFGEGGTEGAGREGRAEGMERRGRDGRDGMEGTGRWGWDGGDGTERMAVAFCVDVATSKDLECHSGCYRFWEQRKRQVGKAIRMVQRKLGSFRT